jgi:hypothetical protein
MSKGPGRIQKTILALIRSREKTAWDLETICRATYPGCVTPTRSQRDAVSRTLKRLALPGTWRTGRIRPDKRWWLYDARRMRWTDIVGVSVVMTDLRDVSTEIDLDDGVRLAITDWPLREGR